MQVKDIMKTKVYGIDITENLAIAFDEMQDKKIKHLPVFEGDQLKGIISDRDLLAVATMVEGSYQFPMQSVEKVMTSDVISCSPDTSLHDALELMLKHEIHSVLICENKTVKGILTDKDILKYMEVKER